MNGPNEVPFPCRCLSNLLGSKKGLVAAAPGLTLCIGLFLVVSVTLIDVAPSMLFAGVLEVGGLHCGTGTAANPVIN